MSLRKRLILDANILIRGILGVRVPDILERYSNRASFYTASVCFSDPEKYLPAILQKQGHIDPGQAFNALNLLRQIVQPLSKQVYCHYEIEAKQRIQQQDIDDWPVIALALTLDCPIWTEDKDFFGTGVATWRTRNVEIYLSE